MSRRMQTCPTRWVPVQTSRMGWASPHRAPSPRPSLGTAAGDWLQGPYVYALYEHYGFSRGEIGRLFIAGFGSSMVFGTAMGTLADK